MEALDDLNDLSTGISIFIGRLDNLSDDIKKGQLKFASLAKAVANVGSSPGRNKGPTEFLRPGHTAHPVELESCNVGSLTPVPVSAPAVTLVVATAAAPTSSGGHRASALLPSGGRRPNGIRTSGAREPTTCQFQEAGTQKRRRSNSAVNAKGAAVYYDSTAHTFFGDLHKSVSKWKTLARKARGNAIMAKIRKVERKTPDGGGAAPEPTKLEADADAPLEADANTPLEAGTTGVADQLLDVYNGLNPLFRRLTSIESMCERAAHRVLQNGSCDEDISSICEYLKEIENLVHEEMDRIQKEDSDALKSANKPQHPRRPRPEYVHKDITTRAPAIGDMEGRVSRLGCSV